MPVLLEGGERALRGIDRQEREVGPAEPLQLRVEIGEVAALQQRVVREIDARNDVLRAERDLLGLGEEVVDAAVEHQPADAADRNLLLGNDLGRVEHIELELVGEVLDRKAASPVPTPGKSPDWIAFQRSRRWKSGSAPLILTASFQITDCRPSFGFQWNLTKVDFPSALTSRKVWTPKPSMKRKRARNRAVGHDPHDHVHAFRRQRDEVPEIVVRGLRLRKAAVGLLLGGVDEIRELDRVLDEEDGDVVADDVPVALFGIELDREAAHVASKIGGAFVAGDGRETHEGGRLLAGPLEKVGAGDVRQRVIVLEITVRAEAARVDDALRNALMVEVEDLLAKMEVFQRGRTARADPE